MFYTEGTTGSLAYPDVVSEKKQSSGSGCTAPWHAQTAASAPPDPLHWHFEANLL